VSQVPGRHLPKGLGKALLRLTNLRNESFESDEPFTSLFDLDEVDEIIDESSRS
jgi:hypothetical protein